jgi:hypothetical protein
MVSYTARSAARPEAAWALLARPQRWHEWAPHLRGAWGLGAPEVELGRRGAARLLGALPVPARVVAKEAGRSWTWRVGPVDVVHRVVPRPAGCLVAVDFEAPRVLEALIVASYGPLVAVLVRRLACRAEEDASGAATQAAGR